MVAQPRVALVARPRVVPAPVVPARVAPAPVAPVARVARPRVAPVARVALRRVAPVRVALVALVALVAMPRVAPVAMPAVTMAVPMNEPVRVLARRGRKLFSAPSSFRGYAQVPARRAGRRVGASLLALVRSNRRFPEKAIGFSPQGSRRQTGLPPGGLGRIRVLPVGRRLVRRESSPAAEIREQLIVPL